MRRLMLIAGLLATLPAQANDETFFNDVSGSWSVYGHSGNENLNPACVAETKWDDGSRLQIIQDLKDGELYINFNNNQWNVEGPYNTQHELTMNMYGKKGVESWTATFNLSTKNSIQIRGIDYKSFLPAFMGYNKMVLIMPGTVENAEVSLVGSAAAVRLMAGCIESAEGNRSIEKFNLQKSSVKGIDI